MNGSGPATASPAVRWVGGRAGRPGPPARVRPDLDRAAGRPRPAGWSAVRSAGTRWSGAARSGRRCGWCCCSRWPRWRSAGWARRRACSSTRPTRARLALDWRNSRQYVAHVLLRHRPAVRHRGPRPAARCPTGTLGRERRHARAEKVRYMEYPVLTGFFQYVNARLADGWLWLAERRPLVPAGAAGGGVLRHLRGLAGAGLAGRGLGGARAAPGPAVGRRAGRAVAAGRGARVHQLRHPGRGAAPPRACSRWPGGARCWPGCCSGIGGAFKFYPLLLLLPVAAGRRCAAASSASPRAWSAARCVTWVAVNAPIALAYPTGLGGVLPPQPDAPGRPRLALLRGQLLHRLGGLRRPAGRRAATRGAQPGERGAVRGCAARRRVLACARRARRGWPRWRSWWWPRSCWSTRCGARSTRCGWCRWPCSRCRAGGCCWPGWPSTRWSGCRGCSTT